MKHGWHGKILIVDLTTRKFRHETIPEHLLEVYIGGRGLGVRLMRDYYRLDPFDPAMPLIFATAPLCATNAPATSTLSLVSVSPLTKTVFDSSTSGEFALQMKRAGLDALMITGEGSEPLFLSIRRESVEFIPAAPLWGKRTDSVFSAVSNLGAVAAIGQAGENGVLLANIMISDGGSFGRGGMGAIMGAKRLKGIAVKGEMKTGIADAEKFDMASRDVIRLLNASPFVSGPFGISDFGSSALVDLVAQRRMTPTANFSRTFFEKSSNYSAFAIKGRFRTVQNGCCGFPMRCITTSPSGELRMPEYDALSHFGALNNIDDLSSIIEFCRICSRAGMDPVSTAATLSAWGEIRGSFLAADEIRSTLEEISSKCGFGETLALGSRRMAEKMGREELSMSVKSLELPAYDPRGAYGTALSFCTSNRGGCHQSALAISHEILRKPVPTDRFSFSGKGRILAISEDSIAAADSMAVCRSALFGASLEEYSELLSAVTGVGYSVKRLQETGSRIFMTERFYNCANGFKLADDILPERFFNEPGSGGDGIEIPPLEKGKFLEELGKYYRIRGLNRDGCFDDAAFLEKQP